MRVPPSKFFKSCQVHRTRFYALQSLHRICIVPVVMGSTAAVSCLCLIFQGFRIPCILLNHVVPAFPAWESWMSWNFSWSFETSNQHCYLFKFFLLLLLLVTVRCVLQSTFREPLGEPLIHCNWMTMFMSSLFCSARTSLPALGLWLIDPFRNDFCTSLPNLGLQSPFRFSYLLESICLKFCQILQR